MNEFGKWFMRLLGGWIPLGTKPFSEWLGKILWVTGVVLVLNFVSGLIIKPPANKNNPTFVALPFSKVGDVNLSNTQKNEEIKKKWWQPIPYVAVAGEIRQSSDGNDTGAKIEAGLRWDF